MDQHRNCISILLNSTLLVNKSIPSHVIEWKCQRSSAVLTNSTVNLNFSSGVPLIGGTAKYFGYALYGLVLLFGVFGNIVVFHVVGFRKKRRNSGDVYTLSLACADFLASLVAPLMMLNHLVTDMSVWFYGAAMCYAMPPILIATMCASAWSLVFISVDRLRVISKPMSPRRHRKCLLAGLSFIWISSLGIGIPYGLRVGLIEGACVDYKDTYIGRGNFLVVLGISFLYIWCVPYFIMTVTYCLIARALKASSFTHDNSRAMELRSKQNARIVKMFIIIVIVFIVLTMPYGIFSFYAYYMGVYGASDIDWKSNLTLSHILFILASANGCVNPIIYAKMQRDIKGYLRNIIHRILSTPCQRCRAMSRGTISSSKTWSISTQKTDQSIA